MYIVEYFCFQKWSGIFKIIFSKLLGSHYSYINAVMMFQIYIFEIIFTDRRIFKNLTFCYSIRSYYTCVKTIAPASQNFLLASYVAIHHYRLLGMTLIIVNNLINNYAVNTLSIQWKT